MANEKDLMSFIRNRKLDEYGSVIYGEDVRNVLEIEMPEYGTKRDFDAVEMQELRAVDYCRNILLGEGKYLAAMKGNYRILLPSENAGQINSYMSTADNKLKRALKLSRNSPATDGKPSHNHARIVMQRESLEQSRQTAGLLK
jgi:hypothetical protein